MVNDNSTNDVAVVEIVQENTPETDEIENNRETVNTTTTTTNDETNGDNSRTVIINIALVTTIILLFLLAGVTLSLLQWLTPPLPFTNDSVRLVYEGPGVVSSAIVGIDNEDPLTALGPSGLGPLPPFPAEGAITLRTDISIASEGVPAMASFIPVCRAVPQQYSLSIPFYTPFPSGKVYTTDCRYLYPRGVDVAVIVKASLYDIRHTRLTMGPSANSNYISSLTSILAKNECHDTYIKPRDDATKETQTPMGFVREITHSQLIHKTCESAFDECESSLVTDSYKMQGSPFFIPRSYSKFTPMYTTYPNSSFMDSYDDHAGDYNSMFPTATRLLAFKSGLHGRWEIEIDNKGHRLTHVELTIVVRPAELKYTFVYQLAVCFLYLLSVPAMLIIVKMIGIILRHRSMVRGELPTSIVEEVFFHDVVVGAVEEARLHAQFLQSRFLEWRSSVKRWWRRRQARARYTRVVPAPESEEPQGEEFYGYHISAVEVSPTSSHSSEEGDVCRICRTKEPASELVAPCACNGTSKYIHKSCLAKWREMTTNPAHRLVCAECKTEYKQEYIVEHTEHPWAVVMRQFLWTVLGRLIGLFGTPILVLAYGYLIKVVFFLITWDPNMYWSLSLYVFIMGSIAFITLFTTFTNCINTVLEYPRNLTMKLPILVALSIAAPLLWGKAWCHLSAAIFNTLPTPEPWFITGCFLWLLSASGIESFSGTLHEWTPRPRASPRDREATQRRRQLALEQAQRHREAGDEAATVA